MGANTKGNWVFGLIVLIIGIIFAVESFSSIEVWSKVWNLWPLILVIWGIKEIWQNKSIFFGIILIALGSIFFAKYFFDFIISENIWQFWPIIIIALGIDHIFKSFGKSGRKIERRVKEEEEI